MIFKVRAEVIETDKLIFLFVDVALTVLIFALFAEECYFVVSTYKHFNITVKHFQTTVRSIWLISIYPVFALSSLLSVIIPRAAYICDFVATCYLSACIFQFSSMLLQYFGHVDRLLSKVKDTGFSLRARPCCCCCLCCPVLPPVRRSLVTVRLMIFQTAVLQPIIQFIAAVLWADDKYREFGIDFTQSYIYVTILKLVSTLTAIYGLNTLHNSAQPHLRTHNTRPKQLALILVQIFFNIQGAIITIPARFNVPACKQGLSSYFQLHEWHHLVLVVEMFLLSVLARIFYRRPLAMDATLEAQSGNLADIYAPETARDHTEADSTQPKISSATEPRPQNDEASRNDGGKCHRGSIGQNVLHSKSLQTITAQPGPAKKCKTDRSATEVHIKSFHNATGTVNPVFEAERSDESKLCQTTVTVRDEKDSGTKQTSQEDVLCADDQSTDSAQNSDKISNADDKILGPNTTLSVSNETTATNSHEQSPDAPEESSKTINIHL
ncbi:hypothetical protein ACOMHN_046416 [Nucella lapillus]